jgi:hypothetical protein
MSRRAAAKANSGSAERAGHPMSERVDPALAAGNRLTLAGHETRHFSWRVKAGLVAKTRPRFEGNW